MVHEYTTRKKTQELLVKMNQDSQMKDMKNNIVSSINSLKDEILNLKFLQGWYHQNQAWGKS